MGDKEAIRWCVYPADIRKACDEVRSVVFYPVSSLIVPPRKRDAQVVGANRLGRGVLEGDVHPGVRRGHLGKVEVCVHVVEELGATHPKHAPP